MSVRHANQAGGCEHLLLNMSGNGAQKAVVQYQGQQRLYKSGSSWYLYNHKTPSAPTLITAGYYDPPFYVRGMSVYLADVATCAVYFDMPFPSMDVTDRAEISGGNQFKGHCVDDFAVGMQHPVSVTRIWLTAATTATSICLYF